jgi:phosphate-selective porin OprO/OprP
MKNFRRTALASAVNLILIGGASEAFAASDNAALEQRIRELEARLAKLEPAADSSDAAAEQDPAVEKLTRKVNTLERKLEVEREVAAGNAKKQPKLEAGPNGFKFSSADGKHEVKLRGSVQTDGRFFVEDDNFKSTDKFELKQARIWLEGKVFSDIYFKIMPDFAASGNILPDAYIDYAYHPAAQLLVGKFKTPLSLERLQGDSDGTFLERAFPTYLASNRDVGVQIHGAFALPGYKAETVPGPIDSKNFLTYQFGVFNGSGDDGSPNNDAKDVGDRKEFDGRLFAHPFQHSGYSWLEGLGIGIAGSLGDAQDEEIKKQATPVSRTTYLDYSKTLKDVDTPLSDGATYRIYPQAYWYAGAFGLMAEYVVSSQNLHSNVNGKRVDVEQNNTAWQILASYVVTGEDNSFGAVKPFAPFNPWEGNWGALQLAARWTELDVDNGTFEILDPNKSASHATAWTLGANWYLNNYALIRADYEQVSFDGGAANGANRPNEQVFATRFQLAF